MLDTSGSSEKHFLAWFLIFRFMWGNSSGSGEFSWLLPGGAAIRRQWYTAGMSTLLWKIREWLTVEGAKFREVHHAPTYTSEESAQARGEELRVGGKALLLKCGDDFRLFVISAALGLDSGKIRRYLNVRQTRFATKEELFELTGLVPGCVPPFGPPILPFPLYAEESIFTNDRIAFNAGSLTDSIILDINDYHRLAQATLFSFCKT
ncbi:MAG: hypothetical protein HJJLKODD_02385 [Phycisphaerae bacterium]|nr:hypothetical protein [Phycisphaerae bacterium]